MDEIERLRSRLEDAQAINNVLKRELTEAERLLRMAQEAGVMPDVWGKIDGFLNRGW